MTSATELRELTDSELNDRLVEAKAEAFNLRFHIATGRQTNSARLQQVKREVARLFTLLKEREISKSNNPTGDE